MSNFYRQRLFIPYALLVLALAGVLPLLWLCLYVHPYYLDDFVNARWTSYSEAQWKLYRAWSGRYFSNAAVMLSPMHWNSLVVFRLAVAGMMLFFTGCYTIALATFLRQCAGLKRLTAYAIGMFAAAVMLNTMPSATEGIFWYSSALTYTVPAALMLLLLLLLNAFEQSDVGHWWHWAGASFLIFAIAGSNESMLVPCIAVLFLGWIRHRRGRQARKLRFYQSLGLVFLLCLLATILAPGNFGRLTHSHTNLGVALIKWVYFTQRAYFRWLAQAPVVALTVVCLGLFRGRVSIRPPMSLYAAFLLPLAVCLSISLASFAVLGAAPLRVLNLACIFALPAWMWFLVNLSAALQPVSSFTGKRSIRNVSVLAGLLIVLCLVNKPHWRPSHAFVALKSLSAGIPQAYDQALQQQADTGTTAWKNYARYTSPQLQQDNLLYLSDSLAMLQKRLPD